MSRGIFLLPLDESDFNFPQNFSGIIFVVEVPD